MNIKKQFLIVLACLLCISTALWTACGASTDGNLSSISSSDSTGLEGNEETYTITFNVVFNGASIDRLSQEVKYGESFTLPTPTLDGYKFKHWVIEGTTDTVVDGIYTWNKDISLKAVWLMSADGWSDIQ